MEQNVTKNEDMECGGEVLIQDWDEEKSGLDINLTCASCSHETIAHMAALVGQNTMLIGQMKKREDEWMSLGPNKEVNEARNLGNK